MMLTRKLLLVGGGATMAIMVTAAIAPSTPAFGSSHKASRKSKAAVAGIAECPSAASIGAASGITYTGPTTEKAAEKSWVVCEYSVQGSVALLVSMYTKDLPLREVSGTAAGPTTKISGIGNAASAFNTIVYVQRDSSPSFSVIDQTGDLTLHQTEAEAKAIIAG